MGLVETLTGKIGETVHESEWIKITQEQVNQFSKATRDFQWIHTNPERAAQESPFGSTIAHGYLTLSLYPYMRGLGSDSIIEFPGVKQIVNYGINKLRLIHPVVVGKSIRGTSILTGVIQIPTGIQVTETFTVEIQDENKPALVGELVMLLM